MADLSRFTQFWDEEVRPLVEKCSGGHELIFKLERAKDEAEKESIVAEMKATGVRDWNAVWYVSQMGFYVEHDLADGRTPAIRMSQVNGCLNDEDYYRNVFNNKDCEEVRNYRELGRKLTKALAML